MFRELFTKQQLETEENLETYLSLAGCNMKLTNQTKYALDLYDEGEHVDRIDPYSYSIIGNKNYRVVVNKRIVSENVQKNDYVSIKDVTDTYASGSTTFGGTQNVQGDVNITNSSIPISGDVNIVGGVEITNSSIPITGTVQIANDTINATIENAEIKTELMNTSISTNPLITFYDNIDEKLEPYKLNRAFEGSWFLQYEAGIKMKENSLVNNFGVLGYIVCKKANGTYVDVFSTEGITYNGSVHQDDFYIDSIPSDLINMRIYGTEIEDPKLKNSKGQQLEAYKVFLTATINEPFFDEITLSVMLPIIPEKNGEYYFVPLKIMGFLNDEGGGDELYDLVKDIEHKANDVERLIEMSQIGKGIANSLAELGRRELNDDYLVNGFHYFTSTARNKPYDEGLTPITNGYVLQQNGSALTHKTQLIINGTGGVDEPFIFVRKTNNRAENYSKYKQIPTKRQIKINLQNGATYNFNTNENAIVQVMYGSNTPTSATYWHLAVPFAIQTQANAVTYYQRISDGQWYVINNTGGERTIIIKIIE